MLYSLLIFSWIGTSFAEEVCYGTCECFSDDPPYGGVDLPQSPYPGGQNMIFELYTDDNIQNPVEISIPDDGSEIEVPPEFNPNNPTAFLIHGWLSSPRNMDDIKDAFLQTDGMPDYNVIIVDWSKGADTDYDVAVSNIRVVGACSGAVASSLQGNDLDPIHCVGHSLGAQSCGQMGKYVIGQRNSILGRISGLDQATPGFDTDNLIVRLDKTDAVFVDIIRTTTIDSNNIEFPYDIGHVNFLPNKAGKQPGCGSPNCDHWACVYYYADTIRNADICTYTANPCSSFEDADANKCETCTPGVDCQRMGFYANAEPGRGAFYLRTVEGPPYCEN